MTSPTTCRAVVFNGDGTWDLRHDFRVPEPPPGGAVLAVEAVGLCHSDVSQLNGHKHVPGEVSPTVPGHEIVGRVQSLGADTDLGVAVGDRVAVNIITFGEPYEGNPFGVRCYGYSFGLDEAEGLWGGYGEYMSILPGTQLVRLTDDISAEELTLFEPLSNMVNWLGQAGFRAGMSIVIQGPGHMGLTCAAYARHLGAGMVIVTGTADDATRLDTARRIGADHTIDVTVDDPVEAVMDLSGSSTPQISYFRWYSNDSGASPGADIFVVEVSDDLATWINVETVGPTGTGTIGPGPIARATACSRPCR